MIPGKTAERGRQQFLARGIGLTEKLIRKPQFPANKEGKGGGGGGTGGGGKKMQATRNPRGGVRLVDSKTNKEEVKMGTVSRGGEGGRPLGGEKSD